MPMCQAGLEHGGWGREGSVERRRSRATALFPYSHPHTPVRSKPRKSKQSKERALHNFAFVRRRSAVVRAALRWCRQGAACRALPSGRCVALVSDLESEFSGRNGRLAREGGVTPVRETGGGSLARPGEGRGERGSGAPAGG